MKIARKNNMSLNTLKNIEKIGGFKVVRKRGELTWEEFDEKREEYPINITEEKGMISFKLQDGPIKEVGVNGCQVDTIIETAKKILEGLNKEFACRENSLAITKLEESLHWLQHRKQDREKRSVEGTSNQ